MKKITIAILLLTASTYVAQAACPAGTRYMCYPSAGGKQQCGCY
jgi:hypothetical protein